MDTNDVTYKIIECIYKVHSALGPGLLENTYEICLVHELIKVGLKVDRQKLLPVRYDNIELDAGYRIDILVEYRVIPELKSIESIAEIHKAQILTYLRLANKKIGLLINFNVSDMKKDIKRLVLSKKQA